MNHEDTEAQRRRLNELSHRVIGLCIDVHRELGPGLLESAYEEAFAYELTAAGIGYKRQRDLPLFYKGIALHCGYRIDFDVADSLIVELKVVNELLPVHQAQVLTYLKLEGRALGLLVNFNVAVLKNGIRRVVAGELFKDEPVSASPAMR
jgi:GxxExxY protein